jgi:L-ascorbate metabolism protein UlaG (beta-lactamase superfamily)
MVGTMRITKFGHACVRVQGDGGVVVLDPGVFTDPVALEGADAILITHEHADHVHPDHLRDSDVPIWTIAAVERLLREQAPDVAERVTVVRPGDRLEVAGTAVEVVGEKHAVIHPDYDRFDNSGYVLQSGGASVYHPGDALTPPGRAVDVLLAPVSAPWLKVSEAIDFVREVAAPRSLAIHDRVYSDVGLDMVASHMANLLPEGQAYERREPGQDL